MATLIHHTPTESEPVAKARAEHAGISVGRHPSSLGTPVIGPKEHSNHGLHVSAHWGKRLRKTPPLWLCVLASFTYVAFAKARYNAPAATAAPTSAPPRVSSVSHAADKASRLDIGLFTVLGARHTVSDAPHVGSLSPGNLTFWVNKPAAQTMYQRLHKSASGATSDEAFLWFECRMAGGQGVIVPCTARALFTADELAAAGRGSEGFSGPASLFQVTEGARERAYEVVSQHVPTGGRFAVELTLSHIGPEDEGAYPTGTVLRQFENIRFATFDVFFDTPAGNAMLDSPRRPDGVLAAYAPPVLADPNAPGAGYYIRQQTSKSGDKRTWRWVEYNEAQVKPKSGRGRLLPGCLAGAHVVLFGDSHMRGWSDVLSLSQGIREIATGPSNDGVTAPSTRGRVTYVRGESIVFTTKVASSKIPPHLRGGWKHVDHQVGVVHALLSEMQRNNSRRAVVVAVNFGSWDLRDVDADEYCGRVTALMAKMKATGTTELEVGGRAVKWVWRLTPSYSYTGKTWRTTDYRTNEKIAAANACVRDAAPHPWAVHDTFQYTYPMFDVPCDSHHYLCPLFPSKPVSAETVAESCPLYADHISAPIGFGCTGLADIESFLSRFVCDY